MKAAACEKGSLCLESGFRVVGLGFLRIFFSLSGSSFFSLKLIYIYVKGGVREGADSFPECIYDLAGLKAKCFGSTCSTAAVRLFFTSR